MRQRGLFRGVNLLAAGLVVTACATTRTPAPRYLLPYPVGTSCVLLQGNNGPWGHEGKAAFAYDFAMPIGSKVTAARDGVVVKVESRYEDGNHKPGWENFIFIAHGDGTFGRYYHLTKDGPIVAAGDRVRAGDWIGRSGNTGASAGPHLHFEVTTKKRRGQSCQMARWRNMPSSETDPPGALVVRREDRHGEEE